MDEGTALAVRREVSGGGIFEAFDDGLSFPLVAVRTGFSVEGVESYRFTRSIVTDDQCEGGVELNGLAAGVVEGADTRQRCGVSDILCMYGKEKTRENRIGIPENRKLIDLR